MGISSNKPFNRQCNVRKGAGPVYNKFCPPTDRANNNNNKVNVKVVKEPCFGEYDNLVQYVYEIDLTGQLGYVDCDYVD